MTTCGNSTLLIHTIIAKYIAKYICYYNKTNITMMISQKFRALNVHCSLNVHFRMQNFTHHSFRTSCLQGFNKVTHNKELQHMGGDRY